MAVEGLSRETIRQRIAQNLMGVEYWKSVASSNGTTTTLVDNTVREGDDVHIGKWLLFTFGSNDGLERQVADWDQSSNTFTLAPALEVSTSSNDPYELFSTQYRPSLIHRAINDAISSLVGRFYKREESQALHADRETARFDLPSEFDMVDRVESRVEVKGEQVHDCQSTFDETTDSDFTQSNDTEDKKNGQSLKLEVAASASAGDVVTDSIGSADLSPYTHLEGWIKSTTALSAGDYVIHLDDATAQADGSDLESLNVPAVSAGTWTYFRVALGNPESDTAIVSIGIEMNVDKGAHTVWFDDIIAVNEDTAVWAKLPKHLWRIDHEARDLVLSGAGVGAAGYRLLKLSGGSNPAQMTSDSDTATVPEEFIVNQATASLLLAGSRGNDEDPDARRSLAAFFQGRANRSKGKAAPLQDARKVR